MVHYLNSLDWNPCLSNLTDCKWEEESHRQSYSIKHGSNKKSFFCCKNITSESIYNEGAKLNESWSRKKETEVESSVKGSSSDYIDLLSAKITVQKLFKHLKILLSWFMYQFWEWLFPTVHFDNFHAINNLIHQSYSLVSLTCSFHSQSSKLFSNPSFKNKNRKNWKRFYKILLCNGTKAIRSTAPTRALGPIFWQSNPVTMISCKGPAQR